MTRRPIIEPFRIKVTEPIRMTTAAERRRILADAHYNLFGIRAEGVIIDLLTDSGTGAMSAEQWAAMMRGDESYAGAKSFYRFEDAVRSLTAMPFVFPTHQGRAAERILCSVVPLRGKVVLSNGLFDTTRANVEAAGARGIDLARETALTSHAPFGGDMDLEAFDEAMKTSKGEIAFVVMTVTNNTVGGQAVSFANLQAVSERCRAAKVMLVLDACRFAENAYRIKKDEPGQGQRPLGEIARAMFDLADAFTMSAKKDAIVNMGGILAVRDPALADAVRLDLIRTEGFPSYGGLAGRDLEALAQGLHEVLDEAYLEYRFAASSYLGRALEAAGIPVVTPVAAHAVYADAGAALPHLGPHDLPGQSLACAMYLAGGVRTCEIGELMFGEHGPKRQLVRFALPRRVYTQSHIDYVGAIAEEVAAVSAKLPAMRITAGADVRLRHFTAKMTPSAPFPLE
ncbi:MAG: tryptophanase [Deltaproteobacteria bacterium]|nr:tryptophanase [Deltaproteobacteria bacterium]